MKGWYLVAFERDVGAGMTPACIGDHALMLVRQGTQLRAFDAACPHRGAHLAHGGRLCDGDAVVCPFHGYRVRLGADGGRPGLAVAEYPLLCVGGMVFVRRAPEHDHGWRRYLEALDADHAIVNGFEMSVRASMETVIENAFDQRHFTAVHGVRTDAFAVRTSEDGALVVESTFHVPMRDPATGRGAVAPVAYQALVVSPGVVAVELGGPAPYTVITGATNTPAGGCVIRLSVALPKRAGTTPSAAVYEPLLQHSRRGLEEDRVIWENLVPSVQPRWMPEDASSQAFLDFCTTHRDA